MKRHDANHASLIRLARVLPFLEGADAFREEEPKPRHPMPLVAFTDEEYEELVPTRSIS